MTSEYESLFDSLIVAPLRRVVGRPLVAVNYYIIWGEFDPETPNECGGCQGVHLVFDGGEVEFDWGFEKALKDRLGNIAYHLMVSDHSARREGLRVWTEENISGLNVFSATDTRLWKNLFGEPLEHIEVLGDRLDETRCSPQAARLSFPSGSVVIAIGMTNDPNGDQPIWTVGDGDEVLVFSEEAWVALPAQGIKGIVDHSFHFSVCKCSNTMFIQTSSFNQFQCDECGRRVMIEISYNRSLFTFSM